MAAIFPLMGSYSSDHVLSDPNVQKFIHRNDLQFDLIINEEVFHDSFLMFAHKYKAPIITICKDISNWISELKLNAQTKKLQVPTE